MKNAGLFSCTSPLEFVTQIMTEVHENNPAYVISNFHKNAFLIIYKINGPIKCFKEL